MTKKDKIIEMHDEGASLNEIVDVVKCNYYYADTVIRLHRPKVRYVKSDSPGIRIFIDMEKSLARTDVIREYDR